MRKVSASAEAGTVLLSTLLVLSLMSAVALALMATLRQSIAKTATLNAYAQADLYADGARDFAEAQLARLAALEGPALNAQLQSLQPVVLPYEGGVMTLAVRDGSHCLRLSGLTDADGVVQDPAVRQFSRLMETLGVDRATADRVADTAADWVDADSQRRPGGAEDGVYLLRTPPHRTANVPFESVAELRALDGMTEALFQTIRPHVCLGRPGAPTRFNIDTAGTQHAPVLAALLGAEFNGDALALEILGARPAGGFGSLEALLAVPALQGDQRPDGFDPAAIAFAPDRIEVEALITFGEVERARLFAFEGLDNGAPVLAYRDWGRGSFRPAPKTRTTPGEGEPRDP